MGRAEVIDTLLETGIALFEKGEFRQARKQFSQAELRRPNDVRAQFWLGAAQYHLGNIGQALPLLEAAAAKGQRPVPDRPAAVHEYLCRCHLSSDTGKAAQLGEAGVRLDPGDPRIRLVAGNACFRLARYDDALAHYEAAWQAEGGRDGRPAFPRSPGQVPGALSSALVALKRWSEALAAVEDALVRDPDNAAYHNRLGMILYDGMGDAESAAAAARRAIDLDPQTLATGGDGVYHYNLTIYLKKLERFDEALKAIDRGIAVSPHRDYKALRQRLLEKARDQEVSRPPETPRLDFSKVGGMKGLKEQVRRIIEVVHTRREEARRYGIVRNGILLYGPPGCGKTFFAEAMAGEFGLNLHRIGLGDARTRYVGAVGEQMEKVFLEARRRLPCLLFFDEFDAVAGSRDDSASSHDRQAVNALLQQIDAHRDVPGLVLAAATNRLHEIDPAVIREGRFDYKVKIYRPDFDARREILQVLLADRPNDKTVDITRLAQQMEGFSAAQVRHVVDAAAMAAMEAGSPIATGHLLEALGNRRDDKRFGGAPLGWADLILPDPVKRKLQFIENFIENPGLIETLGVAPPTGVLLYGPPGTGKTTVARVLASQTDAAFQAVNAADIFTKWFGESEKRVKELFAQARDSVPAIIFIDEIEAVLGRRVSTAGGGDRAANAVVNTFLSEMDGIEPASRVFVIGATNRPDLLDEAVLRPGRLGEAVEIGLPDEKGRLELLRLHTRRMSLNDSVDLVLIASLTKGASGADIKGVCTAAGRNALLRELQAPGAEPAVTMDDFSSSLRELFPEEDWRSGGKPIGFVPPESPEPGG